MLPPLSRVFEICLYSLLNFFPFLIFALYPFLDDLRFSRTKTGLLIVVLTFLQILFGLLACFSTGNISAVLSLISTLSYAFFYFTVIRKSPGQLLFVLLMISNIANLVVITAKCLEGQFFPDFALLPYRYSMSLFMVIVEIFILIPVFIFLKKVITPAISCSQSFHEWRYLWLIPATFYLIWYYMVYGNSTLSGLEIALNPKNIIVSVFVNTGALLIYSIVARLIVNQEQILKLQQQNHQLELQTIQYEKLQERIEDARRAKHDLHHHLSVMQAYLEKKDYESLASYLEQYCKQLPDHSLITFCENIDANIVLSHYAQEAERLGIAYSVVANIPASCPVEDHDLSVLFGNLLENAVDACVASKTTARSIFVRAVYEKGSLCIAIDNTFDGKIIQDPDGTFLSCKHAGKGLGTVSVRTIASKYHGTCRFDWKDQTFFASVICFRK